MRACDHSCRGNAVSILHVLNVSVALGIQHAKRMRRIILSCVACLAVQYSPTLPHKRHDIRRKVTEQKMSVLSETVHILRRIQQHTVTNVNMCSCKVIVVLVRF